MRISHIKITNYSRIADLALDVRGHAVIVDVNDVGKSSLLRLLNLLLSSSTGALYQQLTLADLQDPAAELIVEVTFSDFDDEDRALFPSEIDVAESDQAEPLRVQMTVTADPDDAEAVNIRRWFPDAGHQRAPSREQLLRFGWRYLPATRSASAASVDGPNSALQTLLRALELSEHARCRTLGGYCRVVNAARLAVAAPWVVLLLLGTQSETLRAYDSAGGTLLLAIGAAVCLLAYRIMLHIGRLPEERRVLR